jgi:hypothetical protein
MRMYSTSTMENHGLSFRSRINRWVWRLDGVDADLLQAMEIAPHTDVSEFRITAVSAIQTTKAVQKRSHADIDQDAILEENKRLRVFPESTNEARGS